MSDDARKKLLKQALAKIDELSAKLEQARTAQPSGDGEPIAIVGMGCRFPGRADDPHRLWQNLRDGVDAVGEIPADRWDVDRWFSEDIDAPAKSRSRWAGMIERPDLFDARFFGIAPVDAFHMDPQHRIMLEVAWEAFEDAGLRKSDLAGSRTGTFVGITTHDYDELLLARSDAHLGPYHLTGMSLNFAAGRIAYVLGLEGPALAIDTACSASLVAVHLAMRSLRSRETNLALAGGVNLILSPRPQVVMSKARILSPTGRCRPFDAAADGIVRSDGCGAVVLKRLDDAMRDGDRIWAVLRGSAINQDGRSAGLTVPSKSAQVAVIRAALADGGVDPHEIGYVEAHGTGTPLGDPLEVGALAEALCSGRERDRPLRLGSIKGNLGHTEAAAGIAGLIKAAFTVREGVVAPQLHHRDPNPQVPWDRLPIRIPVEPEPWNDARRLASVSSFGASGTNAHVIVEAPPSASSSLSTGDGPWLLPISGHSPAAVVSQAQAWARAIAERDEAELGDLVHTAVHRRTRYPHRLVIAASDRTDLILKTAAVGSGASIARVRGRGPGELVFVCPGQGGQWAGMVTALVRRDGAFRVAFDECAEALAPLVDASLRDALEDPEALRRIDVVQPLLFSISVALGRQLQAWGLRPSAYVGHSMGEVAAAHLAGALELRDAARIIARRSRLLLRIRGRGRMALVELDERAARAEIAEVGGRMDVAVLNSPRSTVLSGDSEAIDALLQRLEQRGVFARAVNVDVASHSPQVDELREPLLACLEGIAPRAATVPFVSTVRARPLVGTELDPSYWADNLRQPVRFADVVRSLAADGKSTFVELGPHPVLLPALEEAIRDANVDGAAVALSWRDRDGLETSLEALANLAARGHEPDWAVLHPAGRCTSAPTTAWQRERFWPEPTAGRVSLPEGDPLLGESIAIAGRPDLLVRASTVSMAAMPWLADCRLHGSIIVPGAVFVELGRRAAERAGLGPSLALRHVEFTRMLVLPDDEERVVQVVIDTGATPATLTVASAGADGAFTVHATASVVEPIGGERVAVDELQRGCPHHLDGAAFKRELARHGLEFGPALTSLCEVWLDDDIAVARISASEFGPVALEVALASFALLVARHPERPEAAASTSIETFSFDEIPTGPFWAVTTFDASAPRTDDALYGRVRLVADDGRVLAEATGLRVAALDLPEWSPSPDEAAAEAPVELRSVPESERIEHLRELCGRTLESVMRLPPGVLDLDTPVRELGADSLMIMQARARLERQLGLSIPVTALLRQPNIGSLAAFLSECLAA